MKSLLVIVIVLFSISCSSDDSNEDCTCTGRFLIVDGANTSSFTLGNVDCETGETNDPAMNENATFQGCEN